MVSNLWTTFVEYESTTICYHISNIGINYLTIYGNKTLNI